MTAEELIHDICVLEERIIFYTANRPTMVDEIEKLKKRQLTFVNDFARQMCDEQRKECYSIFIDIFFDDEIAKDILNAPYPDSLKKES